MAAACGPAEGTGTDDGLPSTTSETDDSSTTSGDGGTTGDPYGPPDCAALVLPGDPADVAATPRVDRDAEVLALALDPSKAVAPQQHYDVVATDLAAIRALDPTLADVHTGCVFPNAIEFWFFVDAEPSFALFKGEFHVWDCHNAFYDPYGWYPIDGVGWVLELDGVFSDVVRQSYDDLPYLEDSSATWVTDHQLSSGRCTPPENGLTLAATFTPDETLDQRDYRFELATGESIVYRVTPTQPPTPVG